MHTNENPQISPYSKSCYISYNNSYKFTKEGERTLTRNFLKFLSVQLKES